VYEKPQEGRIYSLCADTSRGQGLDYSAFTVVDLTEMPYTIAARYRNNQTSPMIYPNIIHGVAKQYNDAHVLVEINDIGGQVADILYNDMEYENMLITSVRGRKGQTLDGGFGTGQAQLGVRTTSAVKRIGCSVLKGLIEEDKLIVEDFDLIAELVSFVSKKESYEADTGHNDDLVMCLVLFGWLTTQTYFKDMTDLDIRKSLYQEKIQHAEEDLPPFGIIDTGLNIEKQGFVDGEGNRWFDADDDGLRL
jgi:hypothetical protein